MAENLFTLSKVGRKSLQLAYEDQKLQCPICADSKCTVSTVNTRITPSASTSSTSAFTAEKTDKEDSSNSTVDTIKSSHITPTTTSTPTAASLSAIGQQTTKTSDTDTSSLSSPAKTPTAIPLVHKFPMQREQAHTTDKDTMSTTMNPSTPTTTTTATTMPYTHTVSPYLVGFYDAYIDHYRGDLCILFEYMSKGSLMTLCLRSWIPTTQDIAIICFSVLSALVDLHSRDIIHRNINVSRYMHGVI